MFKHKWLFVAVKFAIVISAYATLSFNNVALAVGEFDATVDWTKLPALNQQDGAWKFSDKSMPYLLASKYDIKSVSPENGHVLGFVKGLLSSIVNTTGIIGNSYFLQKMSSLYRCDEIGLGNNYVICWEFSPEIITGKAIINPNFMVGEWEGVINSNSIHWVFNENFLQNEDIGNGREVPYSLNDNGQTISVKIGIDNPIIFTKVDQTHVTYDPPFMNGPAVRLRKTRD